jgi:hypothetical protein
MLSGRQYQPSTLQSALLKQTSEHSMVTLPVVSQKFDAHWKSLVQRLPWAPDPLAAVHAALMSELGSVAGR